MRDSIINRKFSYTYRNGVMYLIAANAVMFYLLRFAQPVIEGIELEYWLSLIPAFVRHGYVWQLFTYMFVHLDFTHFFLNMYSLLLFGTMLERIIGTKEFFLFYFVCGTLSGLILYLYYYFTGAYLAIVLGASGAIYALLFLASVLCPNTQILLFFVIPLRMPVAVAVLAGIEILSQIFAGTDGVAHLGHLGGMVVAYLYCLIRLRVNPVRVWRNPY